MTVYTFLKPRVNIEALDARLRQRFGQAFSGLNYGDGELRVIVIDPDDIPLDALKAEINAHDPDSITPDRQAIIDVLAAWNSGILNRTPTEIHTLLEARIGAWASLAQAKADLSDWLPLIGAALWYLMRDQIEG